VDRTESRRSASKRRQSILELLRLGLSRGATARQLGISKQGISVILRNVPRAELEAALAVGAGLVRCPHCGLWVAPHEAGQPRRSSPAKGEGHATGKGKPRQQNKGRKKRASYRT
jgi:DNA-binding CsgD family transcriptional regulator